MSRKSLLSAAVTLFAAISVALPAAAGAAGFEFEVVRARGEAAAEIAVREGEYRGRWILQNVHGLPKEALQTGAVGRAEGVRRESDERLRADVSFKGTDEELQAIIDWLGSLE